MSAHTVILHVSNHPQDLDRALNATTRLRADLPDAAVRIIVNGPALPGITTTAASLTVPTGVQVEACAAGLDRQGIPADTLQPGVTTVPAAITAIITVQQHGASYLRL